MGTKTKLEFNQNGNANIRQNIDGKDHHFGR